MGDFVKRILRYLFIFIFCFMGANNFVLAKNTVCRYTASNIKVYNTTNKHLQEASVDIEITITPKGKLTFRTPTHSKGVTTNLVARDDFLDVKDFIKSNKHTACPKELAVTTSPHFNNVPEPSVGAAYIAYETYVFATLGNFTSEQTNKIKDITGDATIGDATVATNKKNDNENMKTSVKGNYEKKQKQIEKPEAASPQELIGCGLLGEQTLNIIKKLFRFSRFGIPILVVILGLMDFLGIVFSGEEKNFKEAGNRFVKRLIAGVVVVFVPYILTTLINLSGIPGDYDLKTDELFCAFSDLETKTVGEQAEESTRNVCQNQGSKESCDAKASSGCKWNESESSCYQEKSVGEQASESTRNACENLTDQDSCEDNQSLGCRWDTLSNKCVK